LARSPRQRHDSFDGTYYSKAEPEGVEPAGPNDSQGYITAVVARAIIVIQCDDPAIGKVACVFVGIAEVSSCRIGVYVSQHVTKGGELGYFQLGGSTHCLIVQPGVIDSFVPQPPLGPDASPMKISSHLATAR
jgi:phosphatidylserine decarboxylase